MAVIVNVYWTVVFVRPVRFMEEEGIIMGAEMVVTGWMGFERSMAVYCSI